LKKNKNMKKKDKEKVRKKSYVSRNSRSTRQDFRNDKPRRGKGYSPVVTSNSERLSADKSYERPSSEKEDNEWEVKTSKKPKKTMKKSDNKPSIQVDTSNKYQLLSSPTSPITTSPTYKVLKNTKFQKQEKK